MAVKSATKRRLIQLGVPAEDAHLLADDRNMDAIRAMSLDDVASCFKAKKDSKRVSLVMDVIRALGVGRRKRVAPERISALAEADQGSVIRFNALNHHLVPHHELVPLEEEVTALQPWDLIENEGKSSQKIRRELLPKILITDPIVQVIKELEENKDADLAAGWMNNRVLRVVRRSPSAGISVAFRLVVEAS